jgi:hypothetical protein
MLCYRGISSIHLSSHTPFSETSLYRKDKNTFLGETNIPGKIVNFVLYAWVRISASSFPHYFFRENPLELRQL